MKRIILSSLLIMGIGSLLQAVPSSSTLRGFMAFRLKNVWMLQSAASANESRARLFLALPGINVNAQDAQGRTALHYAAEYGFPGLAQELINKGADISIQDNLGETGLMVAQNNDQEAVETLLEDAIA